MDAPDGMSCVIPSYRCHKVVQAMKIGRFESDGTTGRFFAAEAPRYVDVDGPTYDRLAGGIGLGLVGGYLVIYPGYGYVSWSPAAAFEAGYTLIEDVLQVAPPGPVEA